MMQTDFKISGTTIDGEPIVVFSIIHTEVDADGIPLTDYDPVALDHPCFTKGDVHKVIRGLVEARAHLPLIRKPKPKPKADDGEAK